MKWVDFYGNELKEYKSQSSIDEIDGIYDTHSKYSFYRFILINDEGIRRIKRTFIIYWFIKIPIDNKSTIYKYAKYAWWVIWATCIIIAGLAGIYTLNEKGIFNLFINNRSK
jgi:hypothetical protein